MAKAGEAARLLDALGVAASNEEAAALDATLARRRAALARAEAALKAEAGPDVFVATPPGAHAAALGRDPAS